MGKARFLVYRVVSQKKCDHIIISQGNEYYSEQSTIARRHCCLARHTFVQKSTSEPSLQLYCGTFRTWSLVYYYYLFPRLKKTSKTNPSSLERSTERRAAIAAGASHFCTEIYFEAYSSLQLYCGTFRTWSLVSIIIICSPASKKLRRLLPPH